ncbi:hypothetical protein BH11BAC2_BH11BAC2_14370 [soil metagenome]
MQISDIDEYYLNKPEPLKSYLLALRQIIITSDPLISEAWKYRMPFFMYKGKMFCYVWFHKKSGQPYIGIVEGRKIDHPDLVKGERSRMKIFELDLNKNIPVRKIGTIFKMAKAFY